MNTNQQAIAFSNNRIRPMADTLYGTYLSSKKIIAEWTGQGISGTIIPNDAIVIGDGASVDGRPLVTNAAATSIITRAIEYVAWYEGTSILTATAGRDVTIVACQLNGRAAF